MRDDRCRLDRDDLVIGLGVASAEHQVVVQTGEGQRRTRFKVPHSRAEFEELLRRVEALAAGRGAPRRLFAFEATGHEARQLNRDKSDLTDAEEIAELCRTGMVAQTQLEERPYLTLRRAWGEYRRLREERARLKVLVAHQRYGLAHTRR